MNYALGGGFNSRLNLNLREDKGWTYGAAVISMAMNTPVIYIQLRVLGPMLRTVL